jgi:thiamine-monophosphate kinase
MTKSEIERVSRLSACFAAPAADVRVGIGDDAAVLAVGEGALVWTIDAQVEGTHFRPEWLSWEDVGWRSFMAAASDLAAMGAEPHSALSALALGPQVDDAALDAIAEVIPTTPKDGESGRGAAHLAGDEDAVAGARASA